MADRTLTINHADGGSETYTINRDKFAGVREMVVDGDVVTVDRTAVPKEQDREKTFGGSQSITVKRDIEPLLKDVVGGAAAAYSLRDLNDVLGNANKVVRVRRSSDNAEKDFTASEMGSTLEDWVGVGNDGFVETWYDQSGNGNDATQTVAASQPKIVDAGTYLGEIDFDGVDDQLSASDPVITASFSGTYSGFSVQNVATTEKGYLYGCASPDNGTSIYAQITDGVNALSYVLTNKNAVQFDFISRAGAENLLSFCYNNSVAEMLVNGGGTVTDAGTYDFATGTGNFIIGNRNGGTSAGTYLDGTIKEIIIYNSDQSANREAIETNINNQYDIY